MKQMKIRLHITFVFNIRVELIPKGAKVTELLRYILNFIGLLRMVVSCKFKRYSNTVCFVENYITIRQSAL